MLIYAFSISLIATQYLCISLDSYIGYTQHPAINYIGLTMKTFIHNVQDMKIETNVVPNATAVKIVTIQASEGAYTLTLFADTLKQLECNNKEEAKQC